MDRNERVKSNFRNKFSDKDKSSTSPTLLDVALALNLTIPKFNKKYKFSDSNALDDLSLDELKHSLKSLEIDKLHFESG